MDNRIILEYNDHRRISMQKKLHAPSILICTNDTDDWLIDVVKFYPLSGAILCEYGINRDQLNDLVSLLHKKGYSGIVRGKLSEA
jgi:hypothetical protein